MVRHLSPSLYTRVYLLVILNLWLDFDIVPPYTDPFRVIFSVFVHYFSFGPYLNLRLETIIIIIACAYDKEEDVNQTLAAPLSSGKSYTKERTSLVLVASNEPF